MALLSILAYLFRFYFGLLDSVIKSKKNKTDEEIENELKKQFKLNGILLADVNVARMMDNKLDKGYSDTIPVFIDKDRTTFI